MEIFAGLPSWQVWVSWVSVVVIVISCILIRYIESTPIRIKEPKSRKDKNT